jgi:flagellar hook protein FlgE
MMDVVGNNIANVNTTGFKASQVTFAEAIGQTLSGASASTLGRAGSNPNQVGLGMNLGSIDRIFTQGASQVTGRTTDLAIQGDGFFVVEADGERAYTRSGAFSFDDSGTLGALGGFRVQGWLTDATGVIDTNRPVDDIQLPTAQLIAPAPTAAVAVGGNLSADATVGTVVLSTIDIYDSLGATHTAQFTFTKAGTNTWGLSAQVDGNSLTVADPTLTFDGTGSLTSASLTTLSGYTPAGADPLVFSVDLASGSDLGQFGSNGQTKTLARIATAAFANPAGLMQVGNGNFRSSAASGSPLIGEPGSASRGLLAAGTLEMSNVDLAREFTNLIIAQRGFQANSRVITTSDELLADLVNLKR